MDADEGLGRLRALGFGEADAQELWAHFDGAERRGKQGHGHARIPWLEELEGYDPSAEPTLLEEDEGFQRWHGGGAIGYLVLGRVVRAQLEQPPAHARLVVCERTFPTGMLGHYVRRLADGGLVGVLTANSPRRLGHPEGGPKLAGTNPLAIGIPSSGGDPIVSDVSMGAITWGDVVAGLRPAETSSPSAASRRTRRSRWPWACTCSWTRSCVTRATAPSCSWRDRKPILCRHCGNSPRAFACPAIPSNSLLLSPTRPSRDWAGPRTVRGGRAVSKREGQSVTR